MIPNLRFPPYNQPFVKKSINEILTIGSGKDYKHLSKGKIPVYGTGGLMTTVNDHLYDGESVGIGRKGTIDKPIFLNGKFWTVDTLFYTHSFEDVDPYYVFILFQQINWKKYNEASGVPSLSKTTVGAIQVYVPRIEEQLRIRSLFEAVDQKINLLTKKKEALEIYKKGLMQKIFSQELRFKREDGTDYPEWETYCIADLGEFFNGLTGKNSSHFGHGNSQYVQYSQVFRNSYIKLDECDNVDVEDSDKQNALKVGDALFTTSSEVADEVAFASILLNKPEIDTYLNSFCFGLRLNSFLAPSFAQYLFRTTIFRKAVYPLAQGSTRYNVSKKEVGKVKLFIPNVEEQNHIAKSIRILDSQIEQLILLKNKTEQLKKGLLQQMFV